MIELESIDMVSGVNPKGEPFVTITATGRRPDSSPVLMVGQLPPAEVREHGHAYLAVAEAAEQDAAVMACLVDLLEDRDKAEQLAARIITTLRERRAER